MSVAHTIERDNYDCPIYEDTAQLYGEHKKLLKELEGTVSKLTATRQVHIQQCGINEVLNNQLSASKDTQEEIKEECESFKIKTREYEVEIEGMTRVLYDVLKASDTAKSKKNAARKRNKDLTNQLEEMEKESDTLNDELDERDRQLEALDAEIKCWKDTQSERDHGQVEEVLQN